MSKPHPALVDLAAGRPLPPISDEFELFRSAKEHQMQGLLWQALKRGDLNVTEMVHQSLAAEFLRIKARHQRFWEAYEEISIRLGAEGIDFAAIKGVTNEARWYDEIGERPCRDLDIWLSPYQTNQIATLIRILDPDHPFLNNGDALGTGRYIQAIPLSLGHVSADVHLDPFATGLTTRSAKEIWGQTRVEEFYGCRLRVLDDAGALAVTLVHLNRDAFQKLLPACEVLRITNRRPGSPADAVRLLNAEGLHDHALMTLEAVENDLGIDLGVEWNSPRSRTRRLWSTIWPPTARFCGGSPFRYRFRRLAGIPLSVPGRRREALRYLVRQAFPPDSILRQRHPQSRGPYVWRAASSRLRARRWWQ